MKKIWILIILLIFLVPTFARAQSNSPQITEITITDSGFEPSTLVIPQNNSVRFKNNSLTSSWPASNIHPTHSIYPEFDTKRGLNPGEEWVFEFKRPGSWRFHDHLAAEKTGEIKVLASADGVGEKKEKKLLSGIDMLKLNFSKVYYYFFKDHLNEDFQKVNIIEASKDPKILGGWMSLVGVEKTMEKLLTDAGGGSAYDCHQEAHTIGRVAYQLFSSESLTQGSSICHSGYYHGMIEQFFQERGTDDIAGKVDDLCSGFPTAFSRFECLHGIGHGVEAYLDYDLPRALNTCSELKDDYSKESCYGGVFMENIVVAEGIGVNSVHLTKWANDDPYFPCNAVDQNERLQIQCYMIQTARMLDLNQHKIDKVITLCENAPENMRHICFQSLGRDIAGMTLRIPHNIQTECKKSPEQYFQHCLKGALYVIIEFWAEKMTDQPNSLCKLQENTLDKAHCYQLLGGRLRGIFGSDQAKIEQVCSYAGNEFKNECLRSVRPN